MKISVSLAGLVVIIELMNHLIPAEGMQFNVSSMKGSEDIYLRMKRRREYIGLYIPPPSLNKDL